MAIHTFIAFAALYQAGYTLGPESLTPLVSETSARAAFTKARSISSALQISVSGAPVVNLGADRTNGRQWSVVWNDQLQVDLNAITGSVRTIVNTRLVDSLQHGRPAASLLVITNESSAVSRARAILQGAGSPASLVVSKTTLTEHRQGSWEDAIVLLRAMHNGLRVIGATAMVEFDRKTGELLLLQQNFDYSIVAGNANLTPQTARNAAVAIYEANVVPSNRYALSAEESEKAYTARSNGFGSTAEASDLTVRRVRLAYLVRFGPDSIWIDAVDGRSLGGTMASVRPTL